MGVGIKNRFFLTSLFDNILIEFIFQLLNCLKYIMHNIYVGNHIPSCIHMSLNIFIIGNPINFVEYSGRYLI